MPDPPTIDLANEVRQLLDRARLAVAEAYRRLDRATDFAAAAQRRADRMGDEALAAAERLVSLRRHEPRLGSHAEVAS